MASDRMTDRILNSKPEQEELPTRTIRDVPDTYNISIENIRERLNEYKINDMYLIELQAIMNGLHYYVAHRLKPDETYIKLMKQLGDLVDRMKTLGSSADIIETLADIIGAKQ